MNDYEKNSKNMKDTGEIRQNCDNDNDCCFAVSDTAWLRYNVLKRFIHENKIEVKSINLKFHSHLVA